MGRLSRLAIVAIGIIVAVGCARSHPSEPKPELDGVVAILRISTPYGLGHACPVSETSAYTARHVVKPLHGNPEYSVGVTWTDGDGHSGYAKPFGTDMVRDVAYITPLNDGKFPHAFETATEAPVVGDKLKILGYNYEESKAFLYEKLVVATVTNNVAGLIVMKGNPDHGSSGGCVLNSKNELVGIMVWGSPTSRTFEQMAMAVAVYGEYDIFKHLAEQEKSKPKSEPEAEPTDSEVLGLLKRFFGNAEKVN